MNKKQILILIVILLILFTAIFVFSAPQVNHKNSNIESYFGSDENNIDIQIRDMSKVPNEFYSGSSRFSKGLCSKDADCEAQGCSKEICTSQEGVVSTCEVLENAPDKDHYACGCVKDNCGWYLKN